LNLALREAEFGDSEKARQDTKDGLALASTRDVQTVAAIALARIGDSLRAKALADELGKQFPLNSSLQGYWLPTIRAYLAIHDNNPAEALNLLDAATSYELGFPPPQFGPGGLIYPAYVRGQAYLLLHRGKEAANEFQKLLDHRNMLGNSPMFPLTHVQLARALAMSGDPSGARQKYQAFFSLWKDADPDIPILKEAKAEYAKLQ
jgi:tetratricopeptide (TPR) repeat protein